MIAPELPIPVLDDERQSGQSGAVRRFDATWVPRAGADAAARMRRLAVRRAMGVPFLLVVIVAAAVTKAGAAYYAITALVAIGLCTAYVVALRRARQPLAAALSAHLGLPISPKNLPPLANPQVFDRAISNMRAGKPMNAHRRSFFGGFIRIERP